MWSVDPGAVGFLVGSSDSCFLAGGFPTGWCCAPLAVPTGEVHHFQPHCCCSCAFCPRPWVEVIFLLYLQFSWPFFLFNPGSTVFYFCSTQYSVFYGILGGAGVGAWGGLPADCRFDIDPLTLIYRHPLNDLLLRLWRKRLPSQRWSFRLSLTPAFMDVGEPAVFFSLERLMPRVGFCFTPLLLNVLMVNRFFWRSSRSYHLDSISNLTLSLALDALHLLQVQ